jgi:hypothetical protein
MNQALSQDFDITTIPAEFNPLATLDNLGRAQDYSGDDKLFIQFKTEAVMNPAKSTAAGRPIYDDIDMIVIRTPGSQLTSVVAPVKRYMDRFGSRYNAWKSGQKELATGTPLETFPLLFTKPSLIAELKALNIHTVEQLATIPDNVKQKIMGGFELSTRAATWIERAQGLADDTEKKELMARISALEALISSQQPAKVEPAKATTKKD